MARAPKKVTVAEVKIPEIEEPAVEEKAEEIIEEKASETKETVSVELPEIKKEPPVTIKNVKIRLVRNHRCVMGNKLWVFEKGKVYTVPEDVKERLKNAELLDAM